VPAAFQGKKAAVEAGVVAQEKPRNDSFFISAPRQSWERDHRGPYFCGGEFGIVMSGCQRLCRGRPLVR
jgi:hypothetical protein